MHEIPNSLERIHSVFEQANFKYLITVIRARHLEVKQFEKYQLNMKTFIHYCYKFEQINIGEYVKQLNSLEALGNDLNNQNISRFCDCIPFEMIKKNGTNFVTLNHILKSTYL